MPETREIVVTIKTQETQGTPEGSPGTSPASNKPKAPHKSASNPISTEAYETTAAMTAIAVQLGKSAIRNATSLILGEIDYRTQRNLYLKDDYMGQRDYQMSKAWITSFASDAMHMGAACMTGNPAAIAAVALNVTVIKPLKNIQSAVHAMQEQDITIKQMGASLDYTRVRAGYSLSAGSIGEDR